MPVFKVTDNLKLFDAGDFQSNDSQVRNLFDCGGGGFDDEIDPIFDQIGVPSV